MIKREDVYKIGRLGKAHGVKGEVSFQFDDDIFDTTDADYLILETFLYGRVSLPQRLSGFG